ncbi:MAG: tetratricopeptide repeat protein [Rhodospirillaceae bacterium]|nr:MAG: tetratricopeptide repeat protein [Rhodospirillaceae bacterium]
MPIPEKWQPYLLREQSLRDVEAKIARQPQDATSQCDRARLLTELGRTDEARQAYLDILAFDPTHFRALNNLGALLHDTGYRTAARTAYAEAVARHPDQPVGHVNLANTLREGGEIETALLHFEKALQLLPGYVEAHRGMSHIFRDLGDEDKARYHRRLGFAGDAVSVLPYRGSGQPIFAIMLISAAGGNLPIRHLLDDRVFHVTVIVAEFFDLASPLPPHQLFINAVGDADLCAEALDAAFQIIALSAAPIINHPRAVSLTGRAANARRLGSVPGVVAPTIVTLPRADFAAPDAADVLARQELFFPLLLRSSGYHTGLHFLKVDDRTQLGPAAASLPGAELVAIQFLDARGIDQKIRKYRVMAIQGNLYPLHAAVSSHWKIHYFSAEMADSPEHRAEDAAFLNDMPGVLGPRAMAALEAIRDALGLDYAGVDFSLNDRGDILLYEANANMIVPMPEAGEVWAYRRGPVMRVYDAIWKLLTEAAPSA